MILEEVYDNKVSVLSPKEFMTQKKNFPQTVVAFFSKQVMSTFVKYVEPEIIGQLENETSVFPIYKVKYKNRNLAVFHIPVGAPAAATCLEELIILGAKNFLAVGSCGSLDVNLNYGALFVPTTAIRDEGLSYHYLDTKDEIVIDKAATTLLCECMTKKKIPFTKGKTWTTDAIYREVVEKIKNRQERGAKVVEMETSSLAAVAEFRKVHFCQILYIADNLASNYKRGTFRQANNVNTLKQLIMLSFDCACYIDRKFKEKEK